MSKRLKTFAQISLTVDLIFLNLKKLLHLYANFYANANLYSVEVTNSKSFFSFIQFLIQT